MKRTILYYPTIDIPTRSWLRNSILYWDEVSSIVPQNWDNQYLIKLSPDINYLIDEGQFRPIRPDRLIARQWEPKERFEQEFIEIINSNKFKEFIRKTRPFRINGIAGNIRKVKTLSKIHRNKTSDELFYFLRDLNLAKENGKYEEWYLFETHVALIYMSLLAKHIAAIDQNQITVSTDYNIYEKFNFQTVNPGVGFPVVSLNLSRILPTPVNNVPFEKIIDFKKKRQDELLFFRKILMEFNSKVSKSKSVEELKEHTMLFRESMKVGVKTLADTLKDYRIETVSKSMKSLISFKSPAVWTAAAGLVDKYHPFFNTPISLGVKIAGVAATAGIELRANYIEVKNKALSKTRDSAFSYLLKAERAGIISRD